jgi:hypothetical protein
MARHIGKTWNSSEGRITPPSCLPFQCGSCRDKKRTEIRTGGIEFPIPRRFGTSFRDVPRPIAGRDRHIAALRQVRPRGRPESRTSGTGRPQSEAIGAAGTRPPQRPRWSEAMCLPPERRSSNMHKGELFSCAVRGGSNLFFGRLSCLPSDRLAPGGFFRTAGGGIAHRLIGANDGSDVEFHSRHPILGVSALDAFEHSADIG